MNLRLISLIGLLICAAVLGAAEYLEHTYMLATCPLCILQRIVFLALGIVFLAGTILKINGRLGYLYLIVCSIFTLIGTAIATRQFWLQYFAPPQKLSCAASLSHLVDIYPFLEALKVALAGTGECAKVDFTIFTISIAGWSLFLFGSMFILTLYLLYRYTQRSKY